MAYTKTVATFNEGDRVAPKDAFTGCQQGTVKAVADTGHVWVHWDGDSQPYTTEAGKIVLVPPIPEVGKVYSNSRSAFGSLTWRKVIGIVPEGPHVEETIVVYIPLNSAGVGCGNYLQTLGDFWLGTPYLTN